MCWLCQHIYFMSFSHLRVPPSQFIPYSFSLWIHFPPLQDREHQLGELTVLTRSVLLVQYLHRIYISYETYQFRYISGTMWIKSVISSKILEVLSPSLSLCMVTKLILACAKYISTLLPCTQQLLTAHCCQSLLLLTALPWGLNTAVEAPGNAELKSTNSQFRSRSLPVFLFSLILAGSHFLNPFNCCHIRQHPQRQPACLEETGHCEELVTADLSLLQEDPKQKKQLEMLSSWCQVRAPQIKLSDVPTTGPQPCVINEMY